MSYYSLNAIPEEDILEKSRQYQLTVTSTFKILETGVQVQNCNEYFVVQIIRNVMYRNVNPYILYVDMAKYEFDQITREGALISYLLQNGINKTVFQNPHVHVWTQRGPKDEPKQRMMLCFRGSDGTRIYIIERTFNQFMKRIESVNRAYGRFTGDLDDDSSYYSDSNSTSDVDQNYEDDSSDDSSDDCYYY